MKAEGGHLCLCRYSWCFASLWNVAVCSVSRSSHKWSIKRRNLEQNSGNWIRGNTRTSLSGWNWMIVYIWFTVELATTQHLRRTCVFHVNKTHSEEFFRPLGLLWRVLGCLGWSGTSRVCFWTLYKNMKFTIDDRGKKTPLLINRDFMKMANISIDPSRKFILTERLDPQEEN